MLGGFLFIHVFALTGSDDTLLTAPFSLSSTTFLIDELQTEGKDVSGDILSHIDPTTLTLT